MKDKEARGRKAKAANKVINCICRKMYAREGRHFHLNKLLLKSEFLHYHFSDVYVHFVPDMPFTSNL